MVAIHDEIDLPFGEVQARTGGGLAGHNGLKSLKQHLGGADFTRVRVGVGRPDTTDPEIVSRHVLSRFDEPAADVRALIERAADATERLVMQPASRSRSRMSARIRSDAAALRRYGAVLAKPHMAPLFAAASWAGCRSACTRSRRCCC